MAEDYLVESDNTINSSNSPFKAMSETESPISPRRDSNSSSVTEAICRVCRGEGTPDQPLFFPCKCSGSIRYIHQDW